jgi:predicted metal-dependent phosphotriesterase family hydrolase
VRVMTVLGPIEPSDLGVTQTHEHLVPNFKKASHRLDGLQNNEPLIVQEVLLFKQAGGRSLVDLTNHGMERDPRAMRRIAQATGLHVIAGCGWYRQLHYDGHVDRTPTNELAAEMVCDLMEGMDGTDIRAGIIGEIGAEEDYLTAAEERVFRAAARAHKQTNAAIVTHAMGYPVGIPQLDLLEEEGADLGRVVIGHCDHYPVLEYHEAILKRGSYVAFDNFGNMNSYPDHIKLPVLIELLKRGYERQLLLSTDTCLRGHLRAFGGHGFDHLLVNVLPALRQAGVSEEQIQIMMVENPARLLPF